MGVGMTALTSAKVRGVANNGDTDVWTVTMGAAGRSIRGQTTLNIKFSVFSSTI
jgi:hypothetical protein